MNRRTGTRPSGSRLFSVALGEGHTTAVDGWYSRCGRLVVHRGLPDCPSVGWQRADGWAVAHVGTGILIGSRNTKAGAVALRRRLATLGDSWDFTDPDSAVAVLYDLVTFVLSGDSLHRSSSTD